VLYQYPVVASLLQVLFVDHSLWTWRQIANMLVPTRMEYIYPCSSTWYNENIVANRSGPYKSVLCNLVHRRRPCQSLSVHSTP
jgi:hypothetical protein